MTGGTGRQEWIWLTTFLIACYTQREFTRERVAYGYSFSNPRTKCSAIVPQWVVGGGVRGHASDGAWEDEECEEGFGGMQVEDFFDTQRALNIGR